MPLYLVWFLLTVGVLHLASVGRFSPAIIEFVLRYRFSTIPYIFYLQNFWMAVHNTLGGYSGGGTWSLAIGEQFYCTLPFVVRFAHARS